MPSYLNNAQQTCLKATFKQLKVRISAQMNRKRPSIRGKCCVFRVFGTSY
nr:MAG TPA: hypothetical protein [Bacteriophage sp.]